jgi:hypothetical protein
MKTLKKYLLLLLGGIVLCGCQQDDHDAQPQDPLAELAFPLGNGTNAGVFRAQVLDQTIFLREGQGGLVNENRNAFLLGGPNNQPIRAAVGSTLRAEDLSFSLTLFLPSIDYGDYSLETLKKMLSPGTKKLGTPDLSTFDEVGIRDSFVLGFASPKLFGDNRILFSKGTQELGALQILKVSDIPPHPFLGQGVEVRARINCALYTGDALMGELREGEFILKFYLPPFRQP